MEEISSSQPDDDLLGLAEAPELFVEGYRGALLRGGVVKLNLFTSLLENSPRRVRKRAVARLAMPVEDFLEVVAALSALRDDILAARETGDAP
ncbi:MAG: hypothetical protein K2X11_07115 [Acetobacteraceae bacterium]|nr:hypothetical protein [Acetobacteraceae bacterium]